jgi:hypothetical protein
VSFITKLELILLAKGTQIAIDNAIQLALFSSRTGVEEI